MRPLRSIRFKMTYGEQRETAGETNVKGWRSHGGMVRGASPNNRASEERTRLFITLGKLRTWRSSSSPIHGASLPSSMRMISRSNSGGVRSRTEYIDRISGLMGSL